MPDRILAIDPGPETSGVVWFNTKERRVIESNAEMGNDHLRHQLIKTSDLDRLRTLVAIEWIQSYGMPVGASVFDTCLWVGRFVEAWGNHYVMVSRPSIKQTLCGSVRAKDANVRQALVDRYGGSMSKAKGTKKQPGPLYGVKSHAWSALAVAEVVACQE